MKMTEIGWARWYFDKKFFEDYIRFAYGLEEDDFVMLNKIEENEDRETIDLYFITSKIENVFNDSSFSGDCRRDRSKLDNKEFLNKFIDYLTYKINKQKEEEI